MREIEISAASTHNLRDVTLKIPKNRLVAVTGVSGSGKSSLAYDTLFQEGQRRYLESLSVYARQFIKSMEKPEVRTIRGISPTISIDQKHAAFYYNSSVGTISEISPFLRLLFARAATAYCPGCGKQLPRVTSNRLTDILMRRHGERLVRILAPVVRDRKGTYRSLFETYRKRGFLKAMVDGEIRDLDPVPELDRNRRHRISVLIDSLEPATTPRDELQESLELALDEGSGEILVLDGKEENSYSRRLYCVECERALAEPQPATFSFNSPLGACTGCSGTGRGEGDRPCAQCGGGGYRPESLAFRFQGHDIHSLGEMEIGDLLDLFSHLPLEGEEANLLEPLVPQILQRLESFVKLRLDYLSLNRRVHTLSGGELQRTRLVSQIGFKLSGIIYVLDEPSIGMHMSEVADMISVLKELRDRGNTVVVVEHDHYTIRSSEYIVDLGPGSGERGGKIVYSGNIEGFSEVEGSLTADYLYQRIQVTPEGPRETEGGDFLRAKGVTIHNVKGADVAFPTGRLTVVTGVSGSGKSSLVGNALVPVIRSRLNGEVEIPHGVSLESLELPDSIRRVLMVDQSAIGKNARSCPATYVQLMPLIRDLFSETMDAKIRGFEPGRFSFNRTGGRCEACGGLGVRRLEMGFLPRLDVTCAVCGGHRYNSETLQVRYKGCHIAQVLDMTVDKAMAFFNAVPGLHSRLKLLCDVGLGYLRLGQPSTTLSGGESQRIKLSRELSKRSVKPTLYVLDEPTVGLHSDDIRKLIQVLYALVAKGGTVVVIEHNPDIIRAADWVIDLGPGGGRRGGQVLFQGSVDDLIHCPESITGRWLESELRPPGKREGKKEDGNAIQ